MRNSAVWEDLCILLPLIQHQQQYRRLLLRPDWMRSSHSCLEGDPRPDSLEGADLPAGLAAHGAGGGKCWGRMFRPISKYNTVSNYDIVKHTYRNKNLFFISKPQGRYKLVSWLSQVVISWSKLHPVSVLFITALSSPLSPGLSSSSSEGNWLTVESLSAHHHKSFTLPLSLQLTSTLRHLL